MGTCEVKQHPALSLSDGYGAEGPAFQDTPPHPLSFPGGGGGGHLVNPKFFIAAHGLLCG